MTHAIVSEDDYMKTMPKLTIFCLMAALALAAVASPWRSATSVTAQSDTGGDRSFAGEAAPQAASDVRWDLLTPPGSRASQSAVWDAQAGRMLVFGGNDVDGVRND